MESHQGSPLDYGSKFQDPTGIVKLFIHHEDGDKIMNIIQNCYQYLMSPIEEATRKSSISMMILRVNNKSFKLNLNAEDLEKSMGKEVDRGWALPLTIYSFLHINNAGVVPLGVAEQFSVN